MTSGSSIHATIPTDPPQAGQVSISILNTRLRRCAQVIEARRSAAVGSSASAAATAGPPLPRLAGVTRARYWLFGANTPWKRVRFTRGFGTSTASRAMKSSGNRLQGKYLAALLWAYRNSIGDRMPVQVHQWIVIQGIQLQKGVLHITHQ